MNDYITDYLAHQDRIQDYLCHYGVKGMKWGVRHDKRNKMTRAKKKDKILKSASAYASKKSQYSKNTAQDYRNASAQYKKKYGGKDGTSKWLNDMYGKDYKNKKYMKEVFEVNDVHKHAKTEINKEAKEIDKMVSMYDKEAKKWADKSQKLMNTKYSDLSKQDIKEAKKLAKKYEKTLKR